MDELTATLLRTACIAFLENLPHLEQKGLVSQTAIGAAQKELLRAITTPVGEQHQKMLEDLIVALV